jgi:hypothetical protein
VLCHEQPSLLSGTKKWTLEDLASPGEDFDLTRGIIGLGIWLRVVILTAQEAEIGKIMVQSQPGQKSS